MDNPGTYDLFVSAIDTALSAQEQTAITDLDGMSAVTLTAKLAGATGGTSIAAVVQATNDRGTTWHDVARFDFANTACTKWCVLEAEAAKTIATYAALGSEGVNNGLLSDQLRAVITSVGTYTNTTLALRAHVR